MTPEIGSSNPILQEFITTPGELEKLDQGIWLDEDGNFACWDAEFDLLHGIRLSRYVLDEFGQPVQEPSLGKWGLWFEKAERHVAEHRLPGGIWVSTVFLGLDHSFSLDNDTPPVLFETMIFGGPYDHWTDRYSTQDQALHGHLSALKMMIETGRCTTRTKKTLRKRVLPILRRYDEKATR